MNEALRVKRALVQSNDEILISLINSKKKKAHILYIMHHNQFNQIIYTQYGVTVTLGTLKHT